MWIFLFFIIIYFISRQIGRISNAYLQPLDGRQTAELNFQMEIADSGRQIWTDQLSWILRTYWLWIIHLVKKFLPNFCQCSFMMSSTLCLRVARIDSQASTAHRPSFSRIWSEPSRQKINNVREREKRPQFTASQSSIHTSCPVRNV